MSHSAMLFSSELVFFHEFTAAEEVVKKPLGIAKLGISNTVTCKKF